MDLAQYVIPATAGLLSGVVGSLIAPWVQWGIEGRRERMKARRELLLQTRTVLAKPPDVAEFRRLPLYFQIEGFLTPSTRTLIAAKYDKDGKEMLEVRLVGIPSHPYAERVLQDLSTAEKDWGLV